ncbi:MAG TPA: CaiB/BaiF CoA-transferase family protein [Acidimicrobiales bacterium]|nr:CaiB/BaiF CoA-transferase family protein [Acidimicrobiales bacterium]
MPAPGPLEGIRVLDLTQIVAGPLCGRVLADLGASVVKVESPTGDLARAVPPLVDGIGALYAHMNAGKRSACVDIRADGGAELVARLAERSDVLLENFRPAALTGRGLGYEQLRARNPRLVYCSISGFGQDGPWADRRGHAPRLHAEGGTIEVAARLRHTAPVPEVQQHADVYSGFVAVGAVCAALYQRERTGEGQHLDIAIAEALVYASDQAAIDLLRYDGPREFDSWTYPIVSLPSGEAVCLFGNPRRLFDAWMAALGGGDGEGAPADEDEAAARVRRAAEARFSSAEELQEALEAAGVGSGVVQPVTALAESEWALARGLLVEGAVGVRVPAAPWRSSGATIGTTRQAARLGAQTREVLSELGIAAADLDRLEADGVIRCAAT